MTNGNAATVSQYDIAAAGSLSPKSPATVASPGGAYGIAVSANSAYVAQAAGFTLRQYDIAADGKLSAKTPATVLTGGYPSAIALSPDGRSAYVTNYGENSVSQFDVAADGKLTPKAPATVSTGELPLGLALEPGGRGAYVANLGSSNVSQYNVGGRRLADPEGRARGERHLAGGRRRAAGHDRAHGGDRLRAERHRYCTRRRFGFHAGEPGALLRCSLDGSSFAPCSSPQSHSGLADGAHTFTVRATDPYGNSSEASRGWTISDPTLPPPEPTPPAPGPGPDPDPDPGPAPDPDPAPKPGPSNDFDFGKLTVDKRAGTATLVVRLPGEGTVELAGSARVNGARMLAGGPGETSLPIQPRGKAKRRLRARGRARVPVQVTFTPTGGRPNTRTTTVRLSGNDDDVVDIRQGLCVHTWSRV